MCYNLSKKIKRGLLMSDAIFKKRKELLELAVKNGLNSTPTIKCSQELDDMIIAYQRMQLAKKQQPSPAY